MGNSRPGKPVLFVALLLPLSACTSAAPSGIEKLTAPTAVSLEVTTAQTVMLQSVNSGKVVDIYNGVNANGARIQQWDAWSGPMQQWTLQQQSDGSVAFYNPLTGKVLDVSGGSQDNGAQVWLWTPTGGSNQHWKATKLADGNYTFTNVNSGKCMDLLGLRTDDGAPLGQWDCNGKANQEWALVSVSGSSTTTTTVTPEPPGQKVGMYYAVWQWEAWTYMNEAKGLGLPQLSIETVLRSRVENGSATGTGYTFGQMQDARIAADAQDFYYQYDPQPGFYCIYHKRSPGALNYNASHEGNYGFGDKPDCPMYQSILSTHAQQISALGVNFIFVDMTNGWDDSAGADAIQTRPFEVLTEEWQKLRAQGMTTPSVVAWQRLPQPPATAGDGQTYALQRVLATYNDPAHQQVIMRDPTSNKMIFLYVGSDSADPAWVNYIESNGGRNDIVAVPMWGPSDSQWCAGYVCLAGSRLDDQPCNQPMTPHSKLGSQSSVTPKYQSPFWASLPFNTVGVHNGLTLRKQFWSALSQDPDWLLIYGWNEQIAQAWSTEGSKSMGFETDPTIGDKGFVDLYGVEYTRDIEPSQQSGSLMYDITQSCLRLYRKGATSCNDPSELCCQGGNFSDNYRYYDGANGTFETYTLNNTGSNRKTLYECSQGTNLFLSTDSNCGGNPVHQPLGLISTVKGGYALRPLYRCANNDGVYFYSLTGGCPNGRLDAQLGYVR